MLFFSGGSALRGASQSLVGHTHNSVHLITPFDSGGSSAALRRAFAMPAVGDLRNRLLALADRTARGHPEIYELFAYRFPVDARRRDLVARLHAMVSGEEPGVASVPEPHRTEVRRHLRTFRDACPSGFDLRGANIGNLVLAGAYLTHGRRLQPALALFTELVEARGAVRPIVDEHLHLAARLADGRTVMGQHRLTGREAPPLDSPVASLHLTRSDTSLELAHPHLSAPVEDIIRSADLICYPVGSFYTSLVATLLPRGVARAIANADAPKVYVPNPGRDPEEIGLSFSGKVETLVRYLAADAPPSVPTSALLHYVLVDVEATGVPDAELERVRRLGVEIVDAKLTGPDASPYLDDGLLVRALLALVDAPYHR